MLKRTFLRAALAAAVTLALVVSCSAPTDGGVPGLEAAKGGKGGPSPTVDATDPSEAPQGTTLDVRVLGTNYDEGSSVDFLLDGKSTRKVKTNSTTFESSTGDLVANITIADDAVVDLYDVRVTTSRGKKGVGIEKFEILQQGPPGQWDPPQLTITMGQGSGGTDAIRADDGANSLYVEEAHISGNGNLMFWLSANGSPRSLTVTTTAFDGTTTDRIYTNNHSNPGGDDSFGLLGMVNGSTGTAVLEVELDSEGVVRYGKDCSGTFGEVEPANKATTTRSADGKTWVITGMSGVHCKRVRPKGKPGMTQVGTAGPVEMTLVQVSP